MSAERYALLGTLARGNEAQALIARLRLATEGRIDDKDAVRAVVDRAIALLERTEDSRDDGGGDASARRARHGPGAVE